MPITNGTFVWYELLTTDLPAARDFYSRVVGWEPMDAQTPGMEYWVFKAGGEHVAGLMTLPEPARRMGAPPNWLGYVAVADVDATANQATASGGRVLNPPMDIPNVGRFTPIADPGGSVIGIYTPANPDSESTVQQMERGHIGWNELYASDVEAGFAFYSRLFGWVKKEAMDMGPMGVYQIFGTDDVTLGGMMTKPPQAPTGYWTYYINVASIDGAVERVRTAGGQIVNGPMEVPGGMWIVQGTDPQHALFALIGAR